MGLARNTLFNLAGTGVPLLVSLATIPLYITLIGLERYGALAIGWLLLGYFGQADFGVGRALTQRIAGLSGADREGRARACWSALTTALAISLAGAVLVWIAGHAYVAGPFDIAPDMRRELLGGLWLLALANPVVALSGVAAGGLMGADRFRLVALANMLGNSAGQLLPLAVAATIGPDLRGLLVAALAGRLIALVCLAVGLWRSLLQRERIAIDRGEIRRLTGFGAWVALSGIIGPLMIYADRLAIGAMMSAAAVAVYAIPFQLATRTQLLPMALVQALFPRLAAENHAGSLDSCRQYTVLVGQVFAPLVIVLICLSAPLFELWLGSGLDRRSIGVAAIVLAGCWINTLANVPYAQIHARGNPRFTALLHSAELPLYAVMLMVLGARFGLNGIAAAFSLRCAIDALVLVWRSGAGMAAIGKGLAAPALLIAAALALAPSLDSWGLALPVAAMLSLLALAAGVVQMPAEPRRFLAVNLANAAPLLARWARAADDRDRA